MPSTTDKVWPHAGVIACSCDIQSEPHESEQSLKIIHTTNIENTFEESSPQISGTMKKSL